MAVEVASLEARFTADTTGFRAGINSVTNGMQNASRSVSSQLDNIGQGFRQTGTQMMAVGGVMTAALGGAVWTAIDFNEAMTNAGAILGNTQSEMQGLSTEIRGIGAASRFGPQMAAEAFYDIVSGVQDASTHMDILNAAIATAEGGSADLGATTSALIAVMNSYGFSADQAAFASDVMTRTVGMGVLTMDQLASAIPQVTGMANSMGIEFDTLSGMLAFMTTKGISASQSATLLNSAMSTLLNPTAGLATAISDLGYESGEAMVAALGLDGAYGAIRDYGGGSFAGLITSQEALRAGLILTDESAGEFFDNFKSGVDGATESARAIQMESVAAQWDVLKSSIQSLAIVIGDAFLPAISEILGYINPIIPKITEWAEAHPDLIRYVGMAAVGITVFGAALVGLGLAFSAASSGLSAISSGLGIVKALLTSTLGPFGLLIAAGAGLYLAWQSNFGGIRDIAKEVFNSIQAFIQKTALPALQTFSDWFTVDALPAARAFLVDQMLPAAKTVFNWLGEVWKVVGPALTMVGDWFTQDVVPQVIGILRDSLLPLFKDVFNWLGEVWKIVGPALGQLATWFLQDALPQILAFISGTVLPGIKAFIDLLRDVWKVVGPALLTMLDWFISTGLPLAVSFIEDTMVPAIDTIVSALSGLWDDVQPGLSRFLENIDAIWAMIRDDIIMPVGDAIQTVIDTLSDIWTAVQPGVEAFSSGIQQTLGPVVDFIGSLAGSVTDLKNGLQSLPGVADQAGDIVSGLASDPAGMISAIGAGIGSIFKRSLPSGAQGRTLPGMVGPTVRDAIIGGPGRLTSNPAALVGTPVSGISSGGGSTRGHDVYIENAYFQTSDLEQLWDQLMRVAVNRGSSSGAYSFVVSR